MDPDAILSNNKNEIETRVHMLGKKWDVWPLDVEWSHMKRSLGRAKIDRPEMNRIVALSEPTFVKLGVEFIHNNFNVRRGLLEDVIRHEIAHLVEYEEFGQGGHGKTWKRVARRVGADPTRTTHIPEGVAKLMAPYYRQCTRCGERLGYLYRRPGKQASKRYCKKCHEEDGVRPRKCILTVHENHEQIL